MIGKKILNYTIEKQIGEGGMGQVYLASNQYIDQKVAVKVLFPHLANNPEVKKRFEQEASMLASLDHPNIVKFLNYFENNDGVFIFMEYVPGKTMEEYINTISGPITEERTYDLFTPLLNAFTYAHNKNIIHRDIKPSNIMITNEGFPKVLDFGIARIIKETVPGMTKIGDKMGTAMYMSPEQVKGLVVDKRSDIYALGVVLHQMIAGQAPYDDTTMSEFEIETKVVEEKLPRTKEFYPYASNEIQLIIDKAVEKLPEDRYQDCEEFKYDLTKEIHPEMELPSTSNPAYRWAAVFMASVLLLGGIWFWDYNRVKVKYYKDYAEAWGVPVGIHQISKKEMRRSEASLKFEYRKYKVRRMTRVNSAGKIQEYRNSEDVERPNDLKIYYKADDGKINYAEYLDRNGKVLYIKDYNQKLNVVIFRHSDQYESELSISGSTTELFKDPFLDKSSEKGQITRWLLEYDRNGFVKKIKYAKHQNTLASDKEGVFGRKMKHDEKGRIVEVMYLRNDGRIKETNLGFGGKKYKYDKEDNRIEAAWVDKEGKPARNAQGHSFEKVYYDEYGNYMQEEYFNLDGTPMINNVGLFGWKREFNEQGFKISYSSYDTEKKPCVSSGGYCGYTSKYDKEGNEIETAYFDTNKEPCFSSNGYAIVQSTYDINGNVTELWCKDKEGKLCFNSSGVAGYKRNYDSLGNEILFEVFDIFKQATLQENGTHGYTAEYDDKSNLTRLTSIGIDGKPVINKNNCASWIAKYNEKGNAVEHWFFDENGDICLRSDDVSGWRSTYDRQGNEIAREYMGIDSTLTMNDEDYARWESKFDEQGNKTQTLYFDENRKLTLTANGNAGWIAEYDDRGNRTKFWMVDTEHKYAKGFLITKQKFNSNNQLVELRFFDSDQTPAVNHKGYAGWKAKYDERGNILKMSFLGKNHQLSKIKEGYAYFTVTYDDRGSMLDKKFFDEHSNPVNSLEFNAPMVRYRYSTVGKEIYSGFFLHDGETAVENEMGVHSKKIEHDHFGRIIGIKSLSKKGELAKTEDGTGHQKIKFDKRGNPIELSYHDMDGNLMKGNLGYAIIKKEFDQKGRIVEQTFFGEQNQAVLHKEGYHKHIKSFDKQGDLVEENYYNIAGNLCLNDKNYASVVYKYNKSGKEIEKTFFNTSNNMIDIDEGYAKKIIHYKEGKISYVKWSKKDGSVVMLRGFDKDENKLYDEYFYPKNYSVKFYTDGREERVKTDFFNRNENEWMHIDGYLTPVSNMNRGKLFLISSDRKKEKRIFSNKLRTSKNFTIEARIKINKSFHKNYFIGLSWTQSSKLESQQYFIIDNKQYRTSGQSKWHNSSALDQGGYNTLKITSNFGKYSFYINGRKIFTSRSMRFNTTNFIGFIYKECSATIDYIKVSNYY